MSTININRRELSERLSQVINAIEQMLVALNPPNPDAENPPEHEGFYRDNNQSQQTPHAPACPKCGGEMEMRDGRKGHFWGCLDYPRCRGTIQPGKEPRLDPRRSTAPGGSDSDTWFQRDRDRNAPAQRYQPRRAMTMQRR